MRRYTTCVLAVAGLLLTATSIAAQVRDADRGATGSLQVFVATSGPGFDRDGYVVALDDEKQSISANGSVVFTAVAAGSYTVTLLDVAENCAVLGSNPRAAAIAQNGVGEVRFEVQCESAGAAAQAQPAVRSQRGGNNRVGLWGGFGFGVGNVGCLESACSNRLWGLSGNARLGGTPSPSVRLAGGTNGFVRWKDGDTFSGGAVTFQVLVFPGAGDFFLIFGGGFAYFVETTGSFSVTETGAGFLIGLGYDASVSKSGNLAITPFINWVPTTVSATIDFVQVGLGLTIN